MKQSIQTPELDLDTNRVTDCAVNSVDLWNAVTLGVSGRPDGQILGAEFIKEKLESSLHTNEFLAEFVEELDSQVQILVGAHRYRIAFNSFTEHGFGEGGKSVRITRLMRGEKVVLVSRQQLFYTSLLDDSEDSSTGRKDELALIDGDDEFSDLIFTILSRM